MGVVVVRVSVCAWGFQLASLKCEDERAISSVADDLRVSTRYTSQVGAKRAKVSKVWQLDGVTHSCVETHSWSCVICGSQSSTLEFTWREGERVRGCERV